MDASSIPIAELVPHASRAIVIDALVEHSALRSIAVAHVDERSTYWEGSGVPAWAGIEYMAQTIAAHGGAEARARGEPPPIGFVLGTRAYAASVDEFPRGCTLTVTVEPEVVDGGFAAFNCAIAIDGVGAGAEGVGNRGVVASAVVTTYRPSAEEIEKLRPAARNP
jgi:predicted hotdog family 3-hydroxylacyl-ACP dehydratase